MPWEHRQPVDLSVPVESCTRMDINKEAVAQQAAVTRVLVQDLEMENQHMGSGVCFSPREEAPFVLSREEAFRAQDHPWAPWQGVASEPSLLFVSCGCDGWGRDESTLMQMRVWTQPVQPKPALVRPTPLTGMGISKPPTSK